MASYSAVINVSVSGQAALDKLEGSTRTIQKLIDGIKQQKDIFNQAVGTEKTRELKKNLENLTNSFALAKDGARQFEVTIGGKTQKVNMYSKTLAGLNSQLSTFRAISDNATVGTDRFVNSLIAANKVSNELSRTQAKAITTGTSVTGTPQNVQEVLALGKAIPNTIQGLTFYQGKLEELIVTLNLTSNEFRAVEEAIASTDARLQSARLTGQTSKITPAAGPTSQTDTVESYAQRARYAQKVADLEYKQLLTGQQITQANLTQTQQTELRNRLEQASEALAKNELDLAQRLTNELRNQRILYERGAKTSSSVELETRRNNILNSTQMLEQKALQLKTKGLDVDHQINFLQTMQNRLRSQGVDLSEQDLNLIDTELIGLRNRLKLENAILSTQKAQQKVREAPAVAAAEQSKQTTGMMQNVLIGGAFPLLFGGGVGAVVGGAAGGLIPGNPMMSIVTSAIGTLVDQFVAGVLEMGKAVNDLVGSFSKLKDAGLFASKQQEFYIQKLIDSGRAQEAANLIQARFIDIVGTQGVQDLQNAGQASARLNKAFAELNLQMQALVAGPLAAFLERLASAVQQQTTVKKAQVVGRQLVEQGDTEAAVRLATEIQKIEGRPDVLLGIADPAKTAQDIQKITDYYAQFVKQVKKDAPISLVDREAAIKSAEQLFVDLREKERAQQDLKRQNAEQYADLVLSLQRQQADLNEQYERRAQDLRISNAEKQLELVQAIGDAQLKQLENEARARQIDAGGGTGLVAEVTAALDAYNIELKRINQEAANAEEKAKLDILKLDVENERFKLDNAKVIARTNLDNQIRIQRINEQINRQNAELSRTNYEQAIQVEAIKLSNVRADARANITIAEAALAQQALTKDQVAYYTTLLNGFKTVLAGTEIAAEQVSRGFIKPSALPTMAAAPTLGQPSTTAIDAQIARTKELTAAFAALEAGQNRANAEQDAYLTLTEKVLKSIIDFDAQTKNIQNQNEALKLRNKLTIEGLAPEIIEGELRIFELNRSYSETLKALDAQLQKLLPVKVENTNEAYKTALAYLAEIEATGNLTDAQKALKKELEGIVALRERLTVGFDTATDTARTTAAAQVQTEQQQIQSAYNQTKVDLKELVSLSTQVTEAAKGISTAFSESFKGLVSGAMSAEEALASFFQGMADYFLDMAAKIIQKWLEMIILNQILNIFPGGSALKTIGNEASAVAFAANGMAFAQNGIVPFANGGIVNSPTLFKFANGGSMRTGIMGEAGPEAILPLSRGANGRLGVEASTSGNTSIVVNVDATGSNVQGSDSDANQLGRLIAVAIQQELVKQQRPGGLLTR